MKEKIVSFVYTKSNNTVTIPWEMHHGCWAWRKRIKISWRRANSLQPKYAICTRHSSPRARHCVEIGASCMTNTPRYSSQSMEASPPSFCSTFRTYMYFIRSPLMTQESTSPSQTYHTLIPLCSVQSSTRARVIHEQFIQMWIQMTTLQHAFLKNREEGGVWCEDQFSALFFFWHLPFSMASYFPIFPMSRHSPAPTMVTHPGEMGGLDYFSMT